MKSRGILLMQLILALSATVTGGIAVAADEGLPPMRHEGRISYASGGIGLDQSHAFMNAMGRFPLVLTFVRTTRGDGNEYLSDVPVTITDTSGATVLNTSSDGPYMLISLPDGRYTINASYQGKSERRAVTILQSQRIRQTFSWSM